MLKHLLTFIAVLLGVSAIGLLLFPTQMLAVVGIVGSAQLDFLLRASGAGVAALVPGVWVARTAPDSPLLRAVLLGIVVYLLLSSLVDLIAYLQSLVNSAAVPSISIRVALALLIVWRVRTQTHRA